jgi:PGDYG protein
MSYANACARRQEFFQMIIRRGDDGRIIVGSRRFDDLEDLSNAVRALKKPIPIVACRIDEPFEVATTEGLMKGNAGDWLMQGVSKELYICPADIFDKSYDILSKQGADEPPGA